MQVRLWSFVGHISQVVEFNDTFNTKKVIHKCQQTFSQACTICSNNQWLNPNSMLSGLKDRNSCHNKVTNIFKDKIYYY